MTSRWFAAVFLLVLLFAGRTAAHEIRPAFLEISERASGIFDVIWKVPARGGAPLAGDPVEGSSASRSPLSGLAAAQKVMPCGCPVPELSPGVLPIHPTFPARATLIGPPRVERMPGAEIKTWRLNLGPNRIEDWEITVHGLEATMADVLVRVSLKDGRSWSHLLRPDSPSYRIGQNGASQFVRLGVEHILLGFDHLLFALGLMLIVSDRWMLFKTITAFTLAHSITLAAATFGIANAPTQAVEACIALSIFFLGPEIVRVWRGQSSLMIRFPWAVAFAFGLLHGLGFASALRELGLPRSEIPAALLFFNIGVELGQLLFVGALLRLIWLAERWEIRWPRWALAAPGYVVGSLGAFWTFQRVTPLLF